MDAKIQRWLIPETHAHPNGYVFKPNCRKSSLERIIPSENINIKILNPQITQTQKARTIRLQSQTANGSFLIANSYLRPTNSP
jgi:hypothetical protein